MVKTLLATVGVLSASILVPSFRNEARAVEKSDRKHDSVDVDVQERKRPKGSKEQAPTKPEISRNRAFLIATETRLKSEIEKAIAYLAKTEKRMPAQSTARLEMLEKLVNLHLELAVYEANAEYRNYDTQYEAWENGGRKGTEPKLNTSRSNNQWKVVAQRAEYVLKTFPRSKNSDVTMFNQAVSYQYLQRDKEAARAYSALITKYPNSVKAGDAYFQLGDFYFDRTDFRNAMNNYKQALRYKRSRGYAWSLFKLGWCSYNLGNHNGALTYWKQTVIAAKVSGDKGGAQLKDEALRDMVYAWAEIKQVEPAIAYYRANGGGKFIAAFLKLLSQTFSYQGQYNEAIKVLKRFQEVEPNSPDGPDAQKEIVGLNYELNRWPQLWTELAAFPRLYGEGSSWAQANSGDRKVVLEAQSLIRDQIMYYAKITHKSAQKDDEKALYAEAMKGYELYLKFYPKGKEVAEVKYNMADIQYFLKDYRESGKLYFEVASLGKENAVIVGKDGKARNVHRDAARYMLDSYYLDFEPELKVLLKQKPDFSKPARPLSGRAQNFVKGCGYYRRWYQDDKKNVKTCDVYITEVYFRNNDKARASRYLWVLATKYSTEKEGLQAVENLIPLYKNDRKALVEAADRLLKIPAYQKGEIGKKLRDLKRGAELEEIGKIADSAKRAKAYEDQGRKNPKAADADKLFYNAAVDYIKAGMVTNAITNYMVVIKEYPKTPQVKDSILQVAKLNDKRLDFAAAAAYYLQFLEKYPKEKEALPALGRACELYAAAESPRAVPTCTELAKTDADGAKVLFDRMIRSAFAAKSYERVTQLTTQNYMKFSLSAEERIIAYYRIYSAYGGRGQTAAQSGEEILKTYQKARGQVSGEALRYVGEMVFKRVSGESAKFAALKLQGGTVDALVGSIQKKVQGLGKLQQAYDQVLATKDAFWGVAALYELGRAREVLAEELDNPPGIKGASLDDVKAKLAPDAQAAKGEAKKFYATALESISKFHVYSKYSQKVVSGYARISGMKMTFEDWVEEPDFVAAEVPESIASAVAGGED